jgi:hypothetical protein
MIRYLVTRSSAVALALLAHAVGWAQTLDPPTLHDFHVAKLDYQGHIPTSNRHWYYSEHGPNQPAAEFDMLDPNRPGILVHGAAYVRGPSSIAVEVTLWNDTDQPVTGEFAAQEARLRAPRNKLWWESDGIQYWEFLSLGASPSSVPLNIAAFGTQTFTLTFSGLPNHVALGALQVRYNMPLSNGIGMYENGTKGGFATWPWIYLLDRQPVGRQEVPWTDFLNYTCRWAYGAAGADLPEKLTYGTHVSNRLGNAKLLYDPGQQYWFIHYILQDANDPFGGATAEVDLAFFTTAMDAFNFPFNAVAMQCMDFGGILATAFHSHGREHQISRLWGVDFPYIVSFRTNGMCPAGTDRSNGANYGPFTFAFHVVASSEGTCFDSSSSYLRDLSFATHMNPAPGWTLPSYWRVYNPFGGSGLPESTGLAHSPFYWSHSWPPSDFDYHRVVAPIVAIYPPPP